LQTAVGLPANCGSLGDESHFSMRFTGRAGGMAPQGSALKAAEANP
jgi:hypothetical protein